MSNKEPYTHSPHAEIMNAMANGEISDEEYRYKTSPTYVLEQKIVSLEAENAQLKKGPNVENDTVSITFTYSHTRGVFTGHFPNNTRFDFIAAPDAPIPAKMRNALQGLMSRAHTAFKHSRAGKPEMTDDEWHTLMEKIAEFEALHGVTRQVARKAKAPKRAGKITNLTLEDLGL